MSKRITDKERLDWIADASFSENEKLRDEQFINIARGLSKLVALRKAIDAVIRQRRGGKK